MQNDLVKLAPHSSTTVIYTDGQYPAIILGLILLDVDALPASPGHEQICSTLGVQVIFAVFRPVFTMLIPSEIES